LLSNIRKSSRVVSVTRFVLVRAATYAALSGGAPAVIAFAVYWKEDFNLRTGRVWLLDESCAGHRTRGHCALSAMLTVSQLSKSFAGRALFDDVSLQVNRGDRIGLVGPNGAGKSTLFSLLLGDVSPDNGTIAIEKNATIGFLPQETAA
jgi:ABC-type glutathione transport system ATPase component